ncbi:MAG TPA: TIGR01212 family radical SAM protein [Thermodesulfobacteriota bacterium]|nr:TIGR01212 family radical SAM protein [Thermodesulfobacteriota bacterium]
MRYYSFNQFLKERFGERVQKVTLDAGFGCPNRDGTKGWGGCIYCDKFGSGNGAKEKYPDIRSQALAGMDHMKKRYQVNKFIPYFQSFSNTYAPVTRLRCLYEEVIHLPHVVGMAVGTRPDCLTKAALELLAGYVSQKMVWLELGLQSVHDATLRLINRGHTYQEFLEGYQLARKYPFLICLHVIIGLPEENREHVLDTAREVARIKPDGIKIHSLYINRDTALEKMYREKKITPLEQKEFVELTCDFLEILPPFVVIQRLTGDPDPKELVAPEWTLRKNETLQLIHQELERRDSRQGKKCTI